jgi:hypothetical protein
MLWRRISLLIPLLLLVLPISSFNIDTAAPVYKLGPSGSYFGFAVAEHFKGEQAV